ncbi:MAG: redoxin domain-containing protein [Gammaproteobacteria bacterium]|jgi:peroxiredoxin|nr:redoxin domain-containing protein [Gammaproteobacteria bacterium]
MPKLLLMLGLAVLASGALAEDILPILGWDDFRDRLLEEGYSASEADERVASMLGALRGMDRDAGADRIGVQAPPFDFDAWLNSEPMDLIDLRGQVVLVRWWTDTCPFCASSAPALRTLHQEYSPEGLALVGVFHPKARRDDPLDLPRVQRAVDQREFEFPIAVDWDWRNRTLKEWWLTGTDRPATSVTFLLDKQGVIRFIHPGMEYHDESGPSDHAMCVDDMLAIRTEIERLLVE